MRVFILSCVILFHLCCGTKAQDELRVGGPFENRDYMYLGMSDHLNPVDTSPGWAEEEEKLMLTGKVLQLDGKTPAPGIVIYYYHTDSKGLYTARDPANDADRRHGRLRGWVKTGSDGSYKIFTSKPASYPNFNAPAHIHVTIKEPGFIPYWLDEFVFEGDPFVDDDYKKEMRNRGGDGVIALKNAGDHFLAIHDIILGKNIPGYPE